MMKQTVKIRCKNNGETKEIAIGSTLKEAYEAFGLSMEEGATLTTSRTRPEGIPKHSKGIRHSLSPINNKQK